MMTDSPTDSITGLMPTPLPTNLRGRVLHAMEEAGQEAREDLDMECILVRLQPRNLPTKLRNNSLSRMRQTQYGAVHRPYSRRSWGRMAAVACVAIMGVFGIASTLQGMLGGAEAQGLARRSVLERTGGDTVQWTADGAPVRKYEVMYEDSFVLSGEDDMTLVIRVPNKTIVSMKGEVI